MLAVVSDRKFGQQLYGYTANTSGTGTHTYNTLANEYIYVASGGNFDQTSNTTETSYDVYLPEVLSFSDYYPFLMKMPGRNNNSAGYRYQGQGQEEDNEFTEGFLSFEYRVHDPRIGRFLSVDPLRKKFPYWSPYAFCGNQVTRSVDIEGLEVSENLNEGEKAIVDENIDEVIQKDVKTLDPFEITHKRGQAGDYIGAWPSIYDPPGKWFKDVDTRQAELFAEINEYAEVINVKGGGSIVKVCQNSELSIEILRQLEENHGIKEQDLDNADKALLFNYHFEPGIDNSHLFSYSTTRVLYSSMVVLPITIPTTYLLLLPGDATTPNTTYVDVKLLATEKVEEYVTFIKSLSDTDKKDDKGYNSTEKEHTKNKRKSTKNKHEKGQARKERDKGNEKGDARRVKHK